MKTNNNPGPQGYPLLSVNVGVSSLHGLIAASLRINQIYIKIDKVKIKPYLHQNLSIGYFHLQEQANSSQCHTLHLDLFCLSDNGI